MNYNYEEIINNLNKEKIEAKLVEDDLETVFFYKKIREDYKLAKFGRKGIFTPKQYGIMFRYCR